MHRLLSLCALLFCSAAYTTATPAQEPPGMLATAKYLFVVRGDWLYQFDVDTLALHRRVPLASAPLSVELPDAATDPTAEEDMVVEEQPAAPRPPRVEAGTAGGRFGGRNLRAREPRKSGAAVEFGLEWLAKHQDEDGRWDADGFMKHDPGKQPQCDGSGNPVHDVGVTGLALLAFLGSGNTLRSGPYKDNVKRAVAWLRDHQSENGLYGKNVAHDFIYDHAIATYAMCEAYGLSQYKLLKSSVQNALNYLESHRNPYAVWRYQPRDNDNDTSVTSWCLLALKSGEFFGLDVNKQALELGVAYLDRVTDENGLVGYTKRGERSSRMPGDHARRFPIDKTETLTAAGLFCRFFLGQKPENTPVMKASADRLLKSLPKWDEQSGTIDHYYWYYGTYAMYQFGGDYWRKWSKRMLPAVIEHQRHEGHAAGSWDPVGVWGESGGRIYSTALMVLTLEAYYRYARIVR